MSLVVQDKRDLWIFHVTIFTQKGWIPGAGNISTSFSCLLSIIQFDMVEKALNGRSSTRNVNETGLWNSFKGLVASPWLLHRSSLFRLCDVQNDLFYKYTSKWMLESDKLINLSEFLLSLHPFTHYTLGYNSLLFRSSESWLVKVQRLRRLFSFSSCVITFDL